MAISRFSTSSVAQGLPKYQKLWDGSTVLFDSDFELIDSVTVGAGGSSTITFTSIPGTYRHLQLRGMTVSSSPNNGITMRYNSDSSSNYSYHGVEGNGSTSGGYNGTSSTSVFAGYTGDATYPSSFICDIVNYANTNKYKTNKMISANDANGTGTRYIVLASGNWRSTNAITSITLTHGASVNFNQYSKFSLYGIRGAS